MSNLVYCAHHARIQTVLKMFHEVQRITQEFDKKNPTKGLDKSKFIQLWDELERIGVACKLGESIHHKRNEYMDLNYGKSDGAISDKILSRHDGILKV
jgi:hypothetical protein